MNSNFFATFVNKKCYSFLQKHLHTDAMVSDLNDLIHDILLETKNEMLVLSTLKINFKKEKIRCNNSVIQFPHLKSAFHIDLKNDIELYLKSTPEFFLSNEKNELPVVIYADDIVASGNESSKLEHYKTYGASITKIEYKNKYQDILKYVMKEFNTVTFTHNNALKRLNPIFFISDNVMAQTAFGFKKSFSNKSKNSCRACTIDGEKFHLYTKKYSLDNVLRETQETFFPKDNNIVFDTFHDLQGICGYNLFLCVHLYKKLLDIDSELLRKNVIKVAQKLRLSSQLVTALKEGIFDLNSKKDVLETKGHFALKGQQTFYLTICFYEIVKKSFSQCSSILTYEKINLIFKVLHYTLSLVFFFSNKKTTETILNRRNFIEDVVEKHFESLFLLTNEKFKMSMKYHNICHYGKMIEIFPNVHLSEFSTLRFEAANSRIKRLLNVGNSYVNPCKTIIQKVLWSNYLNSCVLKTTTENEEHFDITWEYRLPEFSTNNLESFSENPLLFKEYDELNNTLTSIISDV